MGTAEHNAGRYPREENTMSKTKVVINLSTGHEDTEQVTLAFLIGESALRAGNDVIMFLTKEAVRLAQPGEAATIEVAGMPPVERLLEQYTEAGGKMFVCPICVNVRKMEDKALVECATIAGGTQLWDWVGSGATVFSY